MSTISSPPIPQSSGLLLAPELRLSLYETMVLCRTYEEAILREYHADKGPGFDIGKGLVPGEMHLSAGQEPVAAGVCAHLTTDERTSPVVVNGLTDVTALATGWLHTCAVDQAGRVSCWGSNGSGQLANEDTDRASAVTVVS